MGFKALYRRVFRFPRDGSCSPLPFRGAWGGRGLGFRGHGGRDGMGMGVRLTGS